jgi:hypothetical protein
VTVLFLPTKINAQNAKNSGQFLQDSLSVRLYYLCKLWGFLQYYEPLTAKSSPIWDDVLRENISALVSSLEYGNNLGHSLLQKFPDYVRYQEQLHNTPEISDRVSHTNFHWIDDTFIDSLTRTKMRAIPMKSLPLQSFHYINRTSGSAPDIQFKPILLQTTIGKIESLASLFVFWNAVQYLSPHKELFSRHWDSLLVEYIPQFLRVRSNAEYITLFMKLTSHLHDSHVTVISPDLSSIFGKYSIPLKFVLLDSGVVIKEALCCDSLSVQGWRVQEINGMSIDSLLRSRGEMVSASNIGSKKREVARLLRSVNTPITRLMLSDSGKIKEITIECHEGSSQNPKVSKPKQEMIYRIFETAHNDTVAYFDVSTINKTDISTILNILSNKKGVIFDLRKYPQYIVYDLMSRLSHPTQFGSISLIDLQYPGYHSLPKPLYCGKQREYFGKVVILVNENTQSRGEFTAQALRTIPGSLVVGSQTAGADGEVINVALPMNVTISFTTNIVYDTKMKSMQGVGIIPDVEVKPTIAGIRAGRDEVLEKGIEVLRGLLAKKE